MKGLIQRVVNASVSLIETGEVISSINKGIVILVGINRDDTIGDSDFICRKMLNMRLFEDPETNRGWQKSVKDLNLEVLIVSQFTLYSNFKGNRLDFHESMNPTDAKIFYDNFIEMVKENYDESKIKCGEFGAMMNVSICNNGPVTIDLNSRKFKYDENQPHKKNTPLKIKPQKKKKNNNNNNNSDNTNDIQTNPVHDNNSNSNKNLNNQPQ
eukprot:TRINITY_DN784_c0_g3_i4.p1 TRINITY_DN784_c0_g3~~TRINITY_DN784_c0_g3_i4.p1  ORF type:complete len:212 (-),score=32.70 TRINITY_DN784_c0_g3_i4:210-845(-)